MAVGQQWLVSLGAIASSGRFYELVCLPKPQLWWCCGWWRWRPRPLDLCREAKSKASSNCWKIAGSRQAMECGFMSSGEYRQATFVGGSERNSVGRPRFGHLFQRNLKLADFCSKPVKRDADVFLSARKPGDGLRLPSSWHGWYIWWNAAMSFLVLHSQIRWPKYGGWNLAWFQTICSPKKGYKLRYKVSPHSQPAEPMLRYPK